MVTFIAADGSRTELSATTLENAAAKIANALADEFDLAEGDRVGLRLPTHWQRSAWLAGVWTAGCEVCLDADGSDAVDLLVTTVDGLASDGASDSSPATTVVVSLHPFGLPVTEPLPAGVLDATVVVRSQPDAFLGPPPRPSAAALRTGERPLAQEQLLELAVARAGAWGLEPGGRLLVGPDVDVPDGWLAALAVPLAVDASVVLVAGDHDLQRIAEQEKVTAAC